VSLARLIVLLSLAIGIKGQDAGFRPDEQKSIVERSGDYTLRVRRGTTKLLLTINKRNQPAATVNLPSELAQVDKVEFVGPNKVALLGALNGEVSSVVVVDPRTSRIIDKFYGYSLALSPDKRFVAYIKFFPAHFISGVTDVYLYYDFQKTPAENRGHGIPSDDVQSVGRPIYPVGSPNLPGDNTDKPDSEIHMLESGVLVWSPKENRLVFVDRFRGQTYLVMASFSISGSPEVKQQEIKKTDVCLSTDAVQCNFAITSVQFSAEGHVKLNLRPNNSMSSVRPQIELNE
jgi:hypothetical protein